ncbi:MAG TPA: hypothetical protein VD835_15245 [Pyrinomonadaceae bacterium]|nr:hypothetical protein [Pyrinomonadaceae bacterium]
MQPKIVAAAPATRTPPNAPPVYRPQPAPKVLQAKASQSGVAVPGQQQSPHKPNARTATHNPAPATRLTGGVVQACLSMDATANLDYDGDPVGPDLNDPNVVDLLASLKKDYKFTTSQLKKVKQVIQTEPLYNFRGPIHLTNYVNDPDSDPPTLVHNMEGATLLDDISDEFGNTFKGKGIAFSGSRVYALAHSEGATSLWAMQNSSTGYISKRNREIVETWQFPEAKVPITFPSNTKRLMENANLQRPTVMLGNAHAEVNEIVQHAIRSLEELHQSPHDVALMFASDIQHCAECYWAAHAMWKKGNKVPVNATGCGNRLFARWREPWSGFYTEYGSNPFRKSDGSLRGNLTVGEYQPHVLNARVSGSVGNIYK